MWNEGRTISWWIHSKPSGHVYCRIVLELGLGLPGSLPGGRPGTDARLGDNLGTRWNSCAPVRRLDADGTAALANFPHGLPSGTFTIVLDTKYLTQHVMPTMGATVELIRWRSLSLRRWSPVFVLRRRRRRLWWGARQSERMDQLMEKWHDGVWKWHPAAAHTHATGDLILSLLPPLEAFLTKQPHSAHFTVYPLIPLGGSITCQQWPSAYTTDCVCLLLHCVCVHTQYVAWISRFSVALWKKQKILILLSRLVDYLELVWLGFRQHCGDFSNRKDPVSDKSHWINYDLIILSCIDIENAKLPLYLSILVLA